MCQASLLCVPYSLPSPEALPQRDSRARGFPVHYAPTKTMPFRCFHLFSPPHSFPALFAQTHPNKHPSSSNSPLLPQTRGQKSTAPCPLRRVLEGDPILFPLPLRLAGWLAPVQRGVRWRGLRLGQCAQKLMNCRRDAGRQPARSSGERPSCAITDCSCDGGNRRDSADNLI